MWVLMAQDEIMQNLLPHWVHTDADSSGHRGDGLNFIRDRDGLMHVEVGPIGSRLLRGYRHAVGAMARAGNDVLVDEAMFDPEGWSEWATALAGLSVTWVKVDCDLAVSEQRERERPDRREIWGLARGQYSLVHARVEYDLTVDTTNAPTTECAEQLLHALRTESGLSSR